MAVRDLTMNYGVVTVMMHKIPKNRGHVLCSTLCFNLR